MKQSIQISTLIIFTLLVVFPPAVMSEVKISLKNGRDIIVDSCKDSNGKLVCEKMGGSFEIEKKDVLETKGITIERSPSKQVPENKTGQEAESGGREPVKSESDLKGAEKQLGGTLIKGLNPEDEKRLDQITRKKFEYQAERQLLITERERLHEDIKNTGLIKNQEQFDAIKKRIADLETRINMFNEDVRKLNEEERKILGSSKSK